MLSNEVRDAETVDGVDLSCLPPPVAAEQPLRGGTLTADNLKFARVPHVLRTAPSLSRQYHTMFGTWRFDCSSEKETLTQQPVDPTTPRPHVMRACQSCREKKVGISPQTHNPLVEASSLFTVAL